MHKFCTNLEITSEFYAIKVTVSKFHTEEPCHYTKIQAVPWRSVAQYLCNLYLYMYICVCVFVFVVRTYIYIYIYIYITRKHALREQNKQSLMNLKEVS